MTHPDGHAQATAPRLLYLSDIPPENRPGCQPIHRLLLPYPRDRLLFVTGNTYTQHPESSIPSLDRRTIRTAAFPRLLFSRLRSRYAKWLYRSLPYSAHLTAAAVRDFRPDVIVTIAHGYSWILADTVARANRIPLHLFVYDDFVRQSGIRESDRDWAMRRFGDVYRHAAVRWCISEAMAEQYRERYHAPAEVFYPPRGIDTNAIDRPCTTPKRPDGSKVFGFAGSINYPTYGRMLAVLAEVLERQGHHLVVFGGHTPESAARHGFARRNVTFGPFLPADDIPARLRKEVDVLVAPMAFEREYRHDMEISFPSKLADYTAAGLPILIWGPDYCSAVRWARSNPDAAFVVTGHEPTSLLAGVETMTGTPGLLERLAQGAIDAGDAHFDSARCQRRFRETLAASIERR